MAKSNKGGRPTHYRKAFIKIAYELCRNHGYTDERLAEVIGVHLNTVREWKRRHPEFSSALRQGKDEFDSEQVESALLRRAKGFVRKRVTKRTYRRGQRDYTDTQETMEEVAGSVRAQETWLFNRNPERWRRVPKEGQEGQESHILVVPANEDFETWLRSQGIDPEPESDGGPTPEDRLTS